MIKSADWLIDMGPEGGDQGGKIIATGTPEQVARNAQSHTGKFLARALAAHTTCHPMAQRNGAGKAPARRRIQIIEPFSYNRYPEPTPRPRNHERFASCRASPLFSSSQVRRQLVPADMCVGVLLDCRR